MNPFEYTSALQYKVKSHTGQYGFGEFLHPLFPAETRQEKNPKQPGKN